MPPTRITLLLAATVLHALAAVGALPLTPSLTPPSASSTSTGGSSSIIETGQQLLKRGFESLDGVKVLLEPDSEDEGEVVTRRRPSTKQSILVRKLGKAAAITAVGGFAGYAAGKALAYDEEVHRHRGLVPSDYHHAQILHYTNHDAFHAVAGAYMMDALVKGVAAPTLHLTRKAISFGRTCVDALCREMSSAATRRAHSRSSANKKQQSNRLTRSATMVKNEVVKNNHYIRSKSFGRSESMTRSKTMIKFDFFHAKKANTAAKLKSQKSLKGISTSYVVRP